MQIIKGINIYFVKKLLQIELSKSLNYNPFKVVLILHLVFLIFGLFALSRISTDIPFISVMPLYQFPHVYNFFTWIAGYYNLSLVLLVIMMTCLEFNHKTFKQQVLFGLSRQELFTQKIILIFIISLYVAVVLFLMSLFSGLIYSYRITGSLVFERAYMILNSFLQTFAFLSIGLFFALLFKNVILSVLGFGFYRVFFEPILRAFSSPEVKDFYPTKFITNLTPRPEIFNLVKQKMQTAEAFSTGELENFNSFMPKEAGIFQNLSLTIGFTIIILALCYLILQKRSLS